MGVRGAGRTTSLAAVVGLIAGVGVAVSVSGPVIAVDFDVSGVVFDDVEGDGLKAANAGVAGVTVTAYDESGDVVATTTTGGDGTYTLNVVNADTADARIEFSDLPGSYVPGPVGDPALADNGSSVQFVNGTTADVDFGVVDPTACGSVGTGEVTLYTTCFALAEFDGTFASEPAIISFGPDSGVPANAATEPKPTTLATHGEVGAVFGEALTPDGSTLFASAYLKRSTDTGPLGQGGIYTVATDGSGVTNWLDLNAIFAPGSAGHTGNITGRPSVDGAASTEWVADKDAANQIGKTGMGDIDLADDGTLWVVNMQRDATGAANLLGIPTAGAPAMVPSAGDITTVAIPGAICPAGDARPMGLHTREGTTDVYVGGVCSGETDGTPAEAWVQRYDSSAGTWTTVISPIELTNAAFGITADGRPDPWEDIVGGGIWFVGDPPLSSKASHMIADIEFNGDDIVLGARSRFDDAAVGGTPGIGGLFHFCSTGPDSFEFEGTGSCPQPGGTFYESTSLRSDQLSWGTVVYLETLDQVVHTVSDPDAKFQSGGVAFLDGSSGDRLGHYEVYEGSVGLGDPAFGKNAGLGDLEAFEPVVEPCTIPNEIGNYVWIDADGDGIQDPGETPVVGATVRLYDATGTLVATTTTDGSGEYYFVVDPNTQYTIRMDEPADYQAGGPLDGFLPTEADVNGDADDVRDSDGVTGDAAGVGSGDFPEIMLVSPDTAISDHTFDFGFTLPPFDLALRKTVASVDGPLLADGGNGSVTFDIEVVNQGTAVRSIEVTDHLGLPGDIDFEFAIGDQSTADVTDTGDGDTFGVQWIGGGVARIVGATDTDLLDPLESITIQITLTVAADFNPTTDATFDNSAEISGFDVDDTPQTSTLVDDDSTPDGIIDNDGPVIDDEINGTPGGDPDDEDDHDVASVPWYDLALIKEKGDQPYVLDQSVSPIQATFDVTVANQGLTAAQRITVTDTLPPGTAFVALGAVTSSDNAEVAATTATPTTQSFFIDRLDPGESVTFEVVIEVIDTSLGRYVNTAEIDRFESIDGVGSDEPGGPVDVDSTPDADPDDDTFLANGTPDPDDSHNDIGFDSLGDGVNGFDGDDEDDHDREVVVLGYDLALRKTVASADSPIVPGTSTVTWNVEVVNQGLAVDDFRVVDYTTYDDTDLELDLPLGAQAATAADSAGDLWDLTFSNGLLGEPPFVDVAPNSANPTATLDTGESLVIPVVTTVASTWDGSNIVNWAEIETFEGGEVDIDSTPDLIPGNDSQPAVPGDPTDDEIDGTPGGDPDDEDDHDVAELPIYDLALVKTLSATQPYRVDEDVRTISFDITVKNQGEETAYAISVFDTLPTGTSFASLDGVVAGAAIVTADAPSAGSQGFEINVLEPGELVTFGITLNVDDTSQPSYLNIAEISGFDADDDPTNAPDPLAVDIDSTPDTDPSDVIDTTAAVDPAGNNDLNSHNDIDNDRNALGEPIAPPNPDEDDHDQEIVVLPYDLALRKRVNPADVSAGVVDGQNVTFFVEVTNQGRDVQDFDIADYLQPGWDYLAADNATTPTAVTGSRGSSLNYSWSGADFVPGAGNTVAGIVTGTLLAGETVVIPIVLDVDITAPAPDNLENRAEISRFDNDGNAANGDSSDGTVVDVDSTPDADDGTTDGEDPALDLEDDQIDEDGTVAGQDEDDHDVAYTVWFDLSLIKQRATGQDYVLAPSGTSIDVSYDIIVTNQGFLPNFAVEVTDTPPSGATFSSFTFASTGAADVTEAVGVFTIDQIAPAEVVTITATYTIDLTDPSSLDPKPVNTAEISAMQGDVDTDGDGNAERVTVADVDSFPDADPGNDAFDPGDPADPGDIANGVLDPDDGHNDPAVDSAGDGVNNFDGDDEDDHDTEALVWPVDLALRKTFDSVVAEPLFPAGKVQFTVELFNQGLTPVTSLEVTDYVDATMFTFDLADNPDGTTGPSGGDAWLLGGANVGTYGDDGPPLSYSWDGTDPAAPVVSLTGELLPGESVTVPVVLTLAAGWDGSPLVNKAEISTYDTDDDPATPPPPEADSTPDADDDDNQPTNPGDPTDDEIDGVPGGDPDDEDDHDVAGVPIYDLSLIKQRAAGQSFTLDTSGAPPRATFTITVKNQGPSDVTDVVVTDQVPLGMLYVDGDNTANAGAATDVTYNGDGTFTIGSLASGATSTFDVTLQIIDVSLGRYVNGAEISEFSDAAGVSSNDPGGPVDIDSTPDADPGDLLEAGDPNDPDDAANGVLDPDDSHNDIDRDRTDAGAPIDTTLIDEDDQDTEVVVMPFDLALRKTIDATALPAPLLPGSMVTFQLEVFNQGARAVETIEIVDSWLEGEFANPFPQFFGDNLVVPAPALAGPPVDGGYTAPDNDVEYVWSPVDPNEETPSEVLLTLTGELAPGEGVTVPVVLRLPDDLSGLADVTNTGEISRFDDDGDPTNGDSDPDNPDNPPSGPLVEADSTPDPDPDNDGPELDDEIDGTPGGDPVDEDDHDRASIPLYDLSLVKVRSAGQNYVVSPADQVSFDIIVTNQGATDVQNVTVDDQVPTGMAIDATATDAGLPAGVSLAGSTFTIAALSAGGSVTIPVVMDITDPTQVRFVNGAEITRFEDTGGLGSDDPAGPRDVDSLPDGDNGNDDVLDEPTALDPADSHNDPGYDPDGDGNLNEPTTGDEDDDDTEAIVISFDLALRKTVDAAATPSPLYPGGQVTFLVEVINQGGRPVSEIDVTDTFDLAAWQPFSATDNAAGTVVDDGDGDSFDYSFTGDGTDTVTILLSGDSAAAAALDTDETVTVPLVLTARSDLRAAAQLENLAEISRFDDDNDPGNGDSTDDDPNSPFVDEDSTPDTDPGNDGPFIDDEVDGTPGGDPDDQDDADPAFVDLEIFDLALRKTVSSVEPVPALPGVSKVTFGIEVINQGSVDAVDVEVVDYVQAGFDFIAADNAPTAVLGTTWTGADGAASPTTVIDGPIVAGESSFVDIVLLLTVDPEEVVERRNFAEIASADDDGDTGTPPPDDLDSTPDDQNGEPFGPYEDDEVDEDAKTPGPDLSGDGIVDEDDHDGAVLQLPLFDLALTKVVNLGVDGAVAPGNDVTYTITIFNQGDVDATDVVVIDYLPAELTLADADDNGWAAGTGGAITATVPGPIAPDSSATIDVVVTVGPTTGDIVNTAEIVEARDTNGAVRDDVDSTPDDDPTNDAGGTIENDDDVIDNTNGDEDDHDPAVITILPSAIGDRVWYDYDRDGVQDAGEDGVEGVTVELLDADGAIVATDTTDGTGEYLFTDLVPGDYQVRFVLSTLPGSYSVTTQDAGSDDGADSDGDPTTGLAPPTFLDPGETDVSFDLGIVAPDFDLAVSKNVAASDVAARLVTWQVVLTNRGSGTAIGPIEIADFLPAGLTFVDAVTPAGVSCSNLGQQVTCTRAADLAAGEVVTVQIVTRAASTALISNQVEVRAGGRFVEAFEAVLTNNSATAEFQFGEIPVTGGDPARPLVIGLWSLILGLGLVGLAGFRRRRVA